LRVKRACANDPATLTGCNRGWRGICLCWSFSSLPCDAAVWEVSSWSARSPRGMSGRGRTRWTPTSGGASSGARTTWCRLVEGVGSSRSVGGRSGLASTHSAPRHKRGAMTVCPGPGCSVSCSSAAGGRLMPADRVPGLPQSSSTAPRAACWSTFVTLIPCGLVLEPVNGPSASPTRAAARSFERRTRDRRQSSSCPSPVRPSSSSRAASRWPRWRAVSSIMCSTMKRRSVT
jgi:hypothetical protein